MVSWTGFRQTGVEYVRHERYAGSTKYSLRRMVAFATDGIVNFSVAPLRIALKTGFVCVFLALTGALVAIGAKLFGFYTVPGWTTITVAILLLGGAQLFTLGVVGEYVGRIYGEVKGRPLYLVSDTFGIEPLLGRTGPERLRPEEVVPSELDAPVELHD
jgi:dolichol-phosphate mannosyltransferase